MKNAVIFLDIDGVLNSGNSTLPPDLPGDRLIERKSKQIDFILLARFVRLLESTDARVVISSSWRKLFSARQVAVVLFRAGMPREHASRFIGVTDEIWIPHDDPNRAGKERGLQIQRWLDAHPEVDRFVIFDDDSDMAHLHDHLIQTSWLEGLTDAQVDEAIERLR